MPATTLSAEDERVLRELNDKYIHSDQNSDVETLGADAALLHGFSPTRAGT
jgi:hypothetical protein